MAFGIHVAQLVAKDNNILHVLYFKTFLLLGVFS